MGTTTAKGVPIPGLDDPPNGPDAIGDVAAWVDARPGISTLTYTQINALSGVELWPGRIVYQSDAGTSRTIVGPYRYDGANWVSITAGFLPQFKMLRAIATGTYTVDVTDTYTNFGTSGWTLTVDVPTGATEAYVRTSIEGIYAFNAGAGAAAAFQLRAVFDGHNGGDSGKFSAAPGTGRQFWGWSTHFTGLTAGTGKQISLQGKRTDGDNGTDLLSDVFSYLTHDIRFV